MTDVHEPAVRSYNMSQIKAKDTKPELLVRKFLHKNGLRYKLHEKSLPGKPDIVLPKYKTVIFVHGCFWHGHEDCKYFKIPETRSLWWENKIKRNKEKDIENNMLLKKKGWDVITIWECELKKYSKDEYLNSLIVKIRST